MVRTILAWFFLCGICFGQSVGEYYQSMSRDRAIAEKNADWDQSAKISVLKSPADHPRDFGYAKLDELNKGHVGFIDHIRFEVLDLDATGAVLMNNDGKLLRITGAKTDALTSRQKARVVGLVEFVDSTNYNGDKIKTAKFLSAEADAAEVKKIEATKLEEELARNAKKLLKSLIWGDKSEENPMSLKGRDVLLYKNAVQKAEKTIKAAKVVTESKDQMEVDKKGKVQFKSEQAKEVALSEIKKLIVAIQK